MKKRNVIKKAFVLALAFVLLSSVWLPASAATEKTKVVLTHCNLLGYQDGIKYSPQRYVVPVQISKSLAKNNATDFHFYNSLKRGDIHIYKLSATDKTPLPNVILNIYDSEGSILYFKQDTAGNYVLSNSKNGKTDVITDSAGAASLTNLIYGDYYVRERKAVAGYHLLAEDVKITLQSATVEKEIYNTPKTELPNAGSNEHLLWILSGFGFFAVGMLIANKRKEKIEK